MDLYWIGGNGAHTPASVTSGLRYILGPVGYAKFYPPLAVLISGLCALVFFRAMGLGVGMAVVGAVGAALNSNFFSNTCWGLGTRSITLGCVFLALAALSARRLGNPWLNAALAGFAVGMGVVEGADNGVIFSLFVAGFVIWQAWVGREDGGAGGGVRGLGSGVVRLVLVAGLAGFMATQSLISLFDIASKGAVSAGADTETKEQKWTFATQWSLPPSETIRVLIPGLYGYRMDTPEGGNYWGRVGESPGAPGSRFSGAGEYAGVLVVLLALWSLGHSFRRSGGVFSDRERRMMWFWGLTLVVSVVLSWGKYAPAFYKLVYSLPYFSSIRNPMKFMHVAHLALMVLSGYGLLGLSRRFLSAAPAGATGAALASSLAAAVAGERWSRAGLVGFVVVSVVGLMAYASGRPGLERHLNDVGFPDPRQAAEIAGFSVGEVMWYVVFAVVSAGVLWLVLAGKLGGRRAGWVPALMGLVLVVDLARANTPWILYWDYRHKYATNPVLDVLRDKPYLARVVSPAPLVDPRAAQAAGGMTHLFQQLYGIEWVQHHFQYYNIQSIDVAQDPRPPADKLAYLKSMRDMARYWQLTNTRYVLGLTRFQEALNQQLDQGRNRFQVKATFELAPKPGVNPTQLQDITAVPATNGPLALFEYTGALPRARLYGQWQVQTNGDEALKVLTDPAFDPWSAVIVSDAIGGPSSTNAPAEAGAVEVVKYAPQRIELKANATVPAVLLWNDRYDKDWVATVDGQPAKLLRANFIMRGVQVPAGAHTVLLEFRPSLKGLKISLAAIVLSVVMSGLLFVVRRGGGAGDGERERDRA